MAPYNSVVPQLPPLSSFLIRSDAAITFIDPSFRLVATGKKANGMYIVDVSRWTSPT